MSDSRFIKILIAVMIAGTLITTAHMAYILYAYENSSIIYFISGEMWP